MSKVLIAGNWKMHLDVSSARTLAERVEKQAGVHKGKLETVIFPSAFTLPVIKPLLKTVSLGIQDIYYADEGAFTGEVSAAQVSDLVKYAIVGHSERRHVFNENYQTITRKAAACVRNQITPIICVGETRHEREENETTQVLNDQVTSALTMLTAQDVTNSIIAYEPVWAIGTGENANPEDVKMSITCIRRCVSEMFGQQTSESIRVLYGGSADGDSAGAYLDLDGVDGLLVGGASLNDHEFGRILTRAANGEE